MPLGFDEARFVDCFAELLALAFPFAFPLLRAAAFFRVVFFFPAMGRLVPLIRFHLPTELAGDLCRAPGYTIGADSVKSRGKGSSPHPATGIARSQPSSVSRSRLGGAVKVRAVLPQAWQGIGVSNAADLVVDLCGLLLAVAPAAHPIPPEEYLAAVLL